MAHGRRTGTFNLDDRDAALYQRAQALLGSAGQTESPEKTLGNQDRFLKEASRRSTERSAPTRVTLPRPTPREVPGTAPQPSADIGPTGRSGFLERSQQSPEEALIAAVYGVSSFSELPQKIAEMSSGGEDQAAILDGVMQSLAFARNERQQGLAFEQQQQDRERELSRLDRQDRLDTIGLRQSLNSGLSENDQRLANFKLAQEFPDIFGEDFADLIDPTPDVERLIQRGTRSLAGFADTGAGAETGGGSLSLQEAAFNVVEGRNRGFGGGAADQMEAEALIERVVLSNPGTFETLQQEVEDILASEPDGLDLAEFTTDLSILLRRLNPDMGRDEFNDTLALLIALNEQDLALLG